jgi:hypothetical protein
MKYRTRKLALDRKEMLPGVLAVAYSMGELKDRFHEIFAPVKLFYASSAISVSFRSS